MFKQSGMKEWIGYKRLATRYGIEAVQPLPVESEIGPSRRTIHNDGVAREIYTAIMRRKTLWPHT